MTPTRGPSRGERRLTVEDLGRLVEVTALTGATAVPRLAVATRRPDITSSTYADEILLFEASGGEPGDGPGAASWVRLESPLISGSCPCLDRDGARLAAVEQEAGEGRVVVWDLATGESRTVLEWPESVCELVFCPDGTRLGFVARERADPRLAYAELAPPPKVIRHLRYRSDATGWIHDRPRHCYALDLASGEVSNLSGTGFDDHDLCWYDDDVVVFVSRRHSGRETDNVSDLFRVDASRGRWPAARAGRAPDGEAVLLTDSRRAWAGPVRDPGSAYLLATYAEVLDYPCHTRLAAIEPLAGELLDLLSDHPWSFDGGQMLDSRGLVSEGDSCVLLRARQGRAELVRVTGWRDHTARVEIVAPGEEAPATVKALTSAGGRLVAAIAGTSRPVEVYDVSAHGSLGSITELNTDLAASITLAPVSHRQVTAPDGTVIDSWMLRDDVTGAATPPRSSPLLLYIQGGPTQLGWDFSFEFQYLAALGMVVLYCNPRGTTGYSEEWARTLCGPAAPHPGRGWGGYDLDDLVTVVTDTLAHDETLDPARIAAAGGSYGGILTALMATRWDGLAAAVAERGVYDFALMGGTSDIGSYAFDTLLGLDAVRDRPEFDRLSPLNFVENLQIPLLLLHSTDDWRCPIPLAEEYFTAARRLGKDVTLVVFEGESHELSRSGNVGHRLQRLALIGDWLAARLEGRLAGFEADAEWAEARAERGQRGEGGEVTTA